MTYLRRFDVIMTLSLRHVPVGNEAQEALLRVHWTSQNIHVSNPVDIKWSFVIRRKPEKLPAILALYTLRPKFTAISQTLFSNAFSSMKMYEFRLRFH